MIDPVPIGGQIIVRTDDLTGPNAAAATATNGTSQFFVIPRRELRFAAIEDVLVDREYLKPEGDYAIVKFRLVNDVERVIVCGFGEDVEGQPLKRSRLALRLYRAITIGRDNVDVTVTSGGDLVHSYQAGREYFP